MRVKLFLIAAALACAGCVSHKQYRSDYSTDPLPLNSGSLPAMADGLALNDVNEKARQKRVFEVYSDTLKLAHIECDDQGGYWETAPDRSVDSVSGLRPGKGRNQMEFLEATIDDDLARNPALYRNGAILLTFVHGWNHNARETNENLIKFRDAAYRVWKDDGQHRPVIAIYLSWRGRVLNNSNSLGLEKVPLVSQALDIPHYLSFWNRKATAEKAGYRAVAESLKRISILRGRIEETEGRPSNKTHSRAIIVGHSFGAAAVFSSVSRTYEDDLMELVHDRDRQKQRPWVNRNWDLVVLVNPAFEALRYVTIARYSRDHRLKTLADSQHKPYIYLPRMIVVGSKTDRPNQLLFPLGQNAATITTSTQGTPWLSQRERLTTSLGSYTPFATHELRATSPNGPAKLYALSIPDAAKGLAASQPLKAGQKSAAAMSAFVTAGVVDDPSSIGPFIVAQADKSILDGHGDIWRVEFRNFLTNLIRAREKAVAQANGVPR